MAATPAPSTWDQRMPLITALTHVLIHPTAAPSLHSQLLVSSQIQASKIRRHPDYYPPLLLSRNSDLLAFSLSLALRRLSGRPLSSWRSKCPFQQPPPLVLSSAVDPAPETWGPEERRRYVRKRLRRGRLGIKVPPLVAVAGPNLALLLGFLWDPVWIRRRPGEG